MSWLTDLFTDEDKSLDWSNIGLTAAGLAGLYNLTGGSDGSIGQFLGLGGGNQQPVGYQGKIPSYTGIRSVVPSTYDPLRRPGSGGQRYFTDMNYAAPDAVAAAQAAANTQATGLAALNAANPARQVRPQLRYTPEQIQRSFYDIRDQANANNWNRDQRDSTVMALANQSGVSPYQLSSAIGEPTGLVAQRGKELTGLAAPTAPVNVPNASSGIMGTLQNLIDASKQPRSYGTGAPKTGMAAGGLASLNKPNGYYLGGTTDGMADEIPAMIDGQQEAALSSGEFVIPSDVVSHLGNGNSEAGAQVLYNMMDRVRRARTGTAEQGKQINPGKLLPQ